MKNITLSIEENLLQKGRKYAENRKLSFNSLVRELVEKTVEGNSSKWLEDCFARIDKELTKSAKRKWKREVIYNRWKKSS